LGRHRSEESRFQVGEVVASDGGITLIDAVRNPDKLQRLQGRGAHWRLFAQKVLAARLRTVGSFARALGAFWSGITT
jgi:hypothetical protein